MSVKPGSKKETYQKAFDYWEDRINNINKKILESQQQLSFALQECVDLLNQYKNEIVEGNEK